MREGRFSRPLIRRGSGRGVRRAVTPSDPKLMGAALGTLRKAGTGHFSDYRRRGFTTWQCKKADTEGKRIFPSGMFMRNHCERKKRKRGVEPM